MAMVAPDPVLGRRRPGPNIVNVSGGVAAAPGGGMTLDALMQRQKLLEAHQPQAPENMQSPWQGAGFVGQSLMQGFKEGRTERDLSASRDALAHAMTQVDPTTGEYTPEAMATIGALMPEQALKISADLVNSRRESARDEKKHSWDVEGDQARFTHEDTTLKSTQDATAEQNDLNRQADLERQKMQDAQATGNQQAQAEAAKNLAILESKLKQDTAEKWLPMEPPAGSKPGTLWVKSSITGEPKMVGGAGTVIDTGQKTEGTWEGGNATALIKTTTDAANEGAQAQASMGELGQLEKLLADADLPGGLQAKGLQYLKDTFGVSLGAGSDKVAAVTALISRIAPSMRAPGSGPMSDQDMQNFLKGLPNLSNTPEGNAAIMQTLRGLTEYKIAVGQLARQVQGMPYEQARDTFNKGLADLGAKLDPLKAGRETGAAGTPAAAGGGAAVPTPQTQEEFNALPKGAKYIDPDDPSKTVQIKK